MRGRMKNLRLAAIMARRFWFQHRIQIKFIFPWLPIAFIWFAIRAIWYLFISWPVDKIDDVLESSDKRMQMLQGWLLEWER